MAPSLPLPLLGCSRFSKLIQPLLLAVLSPGLCQLRLGHKGGCLPKEPLPGYGAIDVIVFPSVQTVLFQEGDRIIVIGYIPMGCFFDPSSQGRLCLVSRTPQRAMEPLKIATGFLSWEKTPTAQKHFVVILGGATQFHLRGKPAFALQQPSLQLGSHLGMGVFFQFLQHHKTGVLKQIHGTPFLGTLLSQLAIFGLGVDKMDELVRMQ